MTVRQLNATMTVMRNLLLTPISILTLTLVLCGCSQPESSDFGSEIGQQVPNFQLLDSEGKLVSSTDFRGRPLVLNFWAFGCAPCAAEISVIQTFYEKWSAEVLVLLTINLDRDQTQISRSMELSGISYPVLLGDGDTSQLFGLRSIPSTFFIDEDGIIQDKVIGPFSDLADIESHLVKIVR